MYFGGFAQQIHSGSIVMFESRYEKRIVMKCDEDDSRFPIELLNLWDLTELEIIGGNFTYFPEDISILKRLKKLSLISTKISVIPKEVFQLPKLAYLSLKNNRLQALPELETQSHLKELILGRNYLSSKALENFFYQTPHLHYLDLGHNIVSEIPESLYFLKKLTRLNLEDNKLHGLPLKLKELKELHHLSITNNPIPDSEKEVIEKNFNIIF
jgi:Leucine-rich repeat (LRR) protein